MDYVKGTVITIHDVPERAGYTFDYWKGSEYQPGDKYTANENHTFTAQWIADEDDPETPGTTTETKTPGRGTRTGDSNMIVIFLLLTLVSAATITALMIRRKIRIAGVITILLVGTFSISSVFAADGFVINKIDDSDDPVQGAVFDIYGKPEVSWETLPPTETTVSGTKTWTSSTGNNDDLDTSKIPKKYTVRLEKSTDGTNWTTVASQEVSSYKASSAPTDPTDPITPTDKWTFSNLPTKEDGADIQYRVVEETVPAGFTMSGGTKDANGKYNITNTYTPPTSGINLNIIFEQQDTSKDWPAKSYENPDSTTPKTTKIKVGGEEKTVYVFSYTHTVDSGSGPEEIVDTYYADDYTSSYINEWYDSTGSKLDPEAETDPAQKEAIKALIEELKTKAQLQRETTFTTGIFKKNISKTVSVTGPGGFSKTYTVTLGEDANITIPITEAGTYNITHEVAASGDIDNETLALGQGADFADVYMVQSAEVVAAKDGDSFTCSVDKNNVMIDEQVIAAEPAGSKSFILKRELGPSTEADAFWLNRLCNTSASGNTVTFNHYMRGTSEQ